MSKISKVQVFLCHSSQDSQIIETIAKKLNSKFVHVWYDDWKIDYGDSITSKINEGISSSDYLALALSPAAITSEWVEREWTAAFHSEQKWGDIKILPLLVEDCDIPPLLADRKYVDLRKTHRSKNLNKLRKWLVYKASISREKRDQLSTEKQRAFQLSTRLVKPDGKASKDDNRQLPKPVLYHAHFELKGRWGSNKEAAEIADKIAGKVTATLLKVYPLAMIDETTHGVRFPFGEVKGEISKGKAAIDLIVMKGTEMSFSRLTSVIDENITYLEHHFPISANVADIIQQLNNKGALLKYVRGEAVEFETENAEIRVKVEDDSLVFRFSRKRRYKISPSRLPSPSLLLRLTFKNLSVDEFDQEVGSETSTMGW